jgi:photosystem II stability/assembly factor-like uncharacterized protein
VGITIKMLDAQALRYMNMLRIVMLFVVLVFSLYGHTSQLKDVLDSASLPTERSLISLLTDITEAGDRLVAVGEYGHILFSDDGGKSWSQAQVPVQTALTSVVFVSDKKGWAAGHDAVILATEDGGETWQKQLDGRATGAKLLAAAQAWQERLQAQIDAGEGNQEELMMQMDTVTMANDEAQREVEIGPNRPFLDIMFTNAKEGYAVGAFGYFFTTTDGGQTWEDSSSKLPNPEFLNLYSIARLADGSFIIVGEFGTVMRSADGVSGWELQDIGYQGSLFGVFADHDAGDVIIIGLKGSVFVSNDNGANWRRALVPVNSSLLGLTKLDSGKFVLVGVAGTAVVADFAQDEYSPIPLQLRSHLSGVAAGSEDDLVLIGQNGVIRITKTGERLTSSYQAEVAK